ncbi:glycosyltransferase family 4 protein [Clostridium paraputrificum]|uniref:glycosyltransferase family 4 protein n=1 Tax=Clostridium paraputrificum TaxID=29363 RepID=UPI0003F70F1B|nr:glycosyltransferase family 4 protein [Clostridium paraputrificum]
MKKLLIMASLFWPQKHGGGPTISIWNLVHAIKDQFDIYVISKNHELNDKERLPGIEDGWNKFEFGNAYYTRYGHHSVKEIIELINEVKPDIIYQNSFFSFDDLWPVLLYRKTHPEVKVIVAPRGEFYPERIKVGHLKKKIYGRLLKLSGLIKDVFFQGTAEEECVQIKEFLGVHLEKIYNIQNISIMKQENENIEKKRGKLDLVYIARIHPTKNTLKALEYLKELEGNITYDIYGAIEDGKYWDECLRVIRELPSNIKVSYKGIINHDSVAETLIKYHAYYMPTDGENFGHSIVEAMLMGRIIIISNHTPWTDVNQYGGYAIPVEDKNKYVEILNYLCDIEQDIYEKRCNSIRSFIINRLNIQETIEKYIKAFDKEK